MTKTYNIFSEGSGKVFQFNGNIIECARNQLNKVGNLAGRVSRWLNQTTPGHLLKAAAFGVPACVLSLLTLSFAVKAAVGVVNGTLAFASIAGIPAGLSVYAIAAADALISYGLFHLTVYCFEKALEEMELAFDIYERNAS